MDETRGRREPSERGETMSKENENAKITRTYHTPNNFIFASGSLLQLGMPYFRKTAIGGMEGFGANPKLFALGGFWSFCEVIGPTLTLPMMPFEQWPILASSSMTYIMYHTTLSKEFLSVLSNIQTKHKQHKISI